MLGLILVCLAALAVLVAGFWVSRPIPVVWRYLFRLALLAMVAGLMLPSSAIDWVRDVLSLLDEEQQGDGSQSEDPTAVSGPGQLPAAEEASIADLEAWAGTRSPNIPAAEEAPQSPADDDRLPMPASEADGRLSTDDLPADAETDGDTDAEAVAQADSEAADGPAAAVPSLVEASPSLPSDQANLEPINGLVRMVEERESGERTMTMVILDQGQRHGLENGHRLRVERDGQALVLLSVFDVRDRISVAVVLDGTWKVDAENRQIQIGDGVVRDD